MGRGYVVPAISIAAFFILLLLAYNILLNDSQKCNCDKGKEDEGKPLHKETVDNSDNKLSIQAELKVPPFRSLSDKSTVIIPTYKRINLLKKVLRNYCSMISHIDSIIIVWNDVEEEIPETLKSFPCDVTIHLKREKVNSLNNRFKPFPEIRTDCK